jgi:hypothetical protein
MMGKIGVDQPLNVPGKGNKLVSSWIPQFQEKRECGAILRGQSQAGPAIRVQ